MVSWADFEAADPELASIGRRLLFRGDHGEALLATVRDGLAPRVHPIGVGIVDGRLVAFINASPKRRDLEADGRYALHNHIDLEVPEEVQVRGRALRVGDSFRSVVAGQWYFTPDDSYDLFEFTIDSVLVGLRGSGDEWPPRYRSWSATDR
jgi:hypothetical protein